MTFLDIWIAYAIVGTTIFSAVFVWAVRSRQFTELDRQRYIALNAADLREHGDAGRRPNRIDRYTWLGLLLITFALMAAAVWLGANARRSPTNNQQLITNNR
ncbi:MAG: hypothetical protein Q7T82_14220 [Armatimonadota bacterium]|nr:hypothetical protein [Armatimonadota bacterium]